MPKDTRPQISPMSETINNELADSRRPAVSVQPDVLTVRKTNEDNAAQQTNHDPIVSRFLSS